MKTNQKIWKLEPMWLFLFFGSCIGLLGCNHQARKVASQNMLEEMRAHIDLNGRDNPNVEVGDVATDIVGTDTNGDTFALSDYRGKVVLLSFAGIW